MWQPEQILLVTRDELGELLRLPQAASWELPVSRNLKQAAWEDGFRRIFGDDLWERTRDQRTHIEVAYDVPLGGQFKIPSIERLRRWKEPRKMALIPMVSGGKMVDRIWTKSPPAPSLETFMPLEEDHLAYLDPDKPLPMPQDFRLDRRYWQLRKDPMGHLYYVELLE